MNFDKLVVNASPIISLTKIEHGDLMVDLSSDLVAPAGVFEEILFYGHDDP